MFRVNWLSENNFYRLPLCVAYYHTKTVSFSCISRVFIDHHKFAFYGSATLVSTVVLTCFIGRNLLDPNDKQQATIYLIFFNLNARCYKNITLKCLLFNKYSYTTKNIILYYIWRFITLWLGIFLSRSSYAISQHWRDRKLC